MSGTWLITGANRGIGLELARQLEARGEDVIATCRRPAPELEGLGVRIERLDVADDASIESLANALADTPIDILINNAGAGGNREGLEELDAQTLRRCFEINSMGPLRVTRALLSNLKAGKRRLVVHITSRMGSIADNTSGGSYAYRMSKAALNMANRSMSLDLRAERITCTLMHPGWVRTDMGGRHAPLSVEDSVSGMLEVIDKLTEDDTGRFLDHTGQPIPW